MRQLKREVKIGNVTIGGKNPIAVQTMLNVPVEDIEGNVAQAKRCEAAVTPLFSLKQRDYLRFRPQWGYFCLLNNPCVKAPNCPHCGQMCSPRCAHDTLAFSCYNSSIGKTRIKMQTFRIIAKNPSHENAASKLVPAAVRFFVLAKFVRSKQHSALLYETAVLLSLPLSARRCAMI